MFSLASTRAATGTYDSDVRDAGTVATWGVIRWRAASRPGEVEIVTRSGNTATPDETWSTWSKAYTVANGERITSPERALPAVAGGAQGACLAAASPRLAGERGMRRGPCSRR